IYRGILPPLGVAALILCASVLVEQAWLVVLVGLAVVLTFCEATDRHMFGFASIACAGAFLRRMRPGWLVAAGTFAALAGLYSLDVGLYVGAATLATLLAMTWPARGDTFRLAALRPLTWYAVGLAIILAPFLIWCAWMG